MGRLGQNPSSRGYATPTYATTPLTARETFGGTSKAGLGRHIGMGPFTYGAIVNGSSGHQASFLAGNSFPAAFRAGQLLDMKYPISDTNQLARIGTGTTGGMTRTPADGVNLKEREEMQTRVDKWNKVWPSMPQRDTPNGCCKTIPHLNQDDDHINITANETLYGNSGPFGDMPQPLANPIGALSNTDVKQAQFTNMPPNGIQGVSFYNLLSGQCGDPQYNTPNQFGDWGTSYIRNPAIYDFVKEQGFNCIRFPLTVWPGSDFGNACDYSYFTTFLDENGNVTDDGDNFIQDIVAGVELAADKGLYSIIDWHTYGKSTDGAYDINGKLPNSEVTGWENFFYNVMKEISESNNVDKINNYLIWEIFNEPEEEWTKWNIGDHPYPIAQINAIRRYEKTLLGGTQHLIIVGTNFNSKLLASSQGGQPGQFGTLPLVDSVTTNICFALHFYTKSHDASTIKNNWGFQSQAETGNKSGVGVVFHNELGKYFPVFISECGSGDAGASNPDWNNFNSVLAGLGLWVDESSSGQVQPGQPIVVWGLTGVDSTLSPPGNYVLIDKPATATSFKGNTNMIELVKLFFGSKN